MAPQKTDAVDCPPTNGSNPPEPASPPANASAVVDLNTTTGTAAADISTLSVDSTNGEHDPYFEPVVTLPEVTIRTYEEDEEEIYKGRCKMFRYVHDTEEGGEWKERGTGNVKFLKHQDRATVRLLMRQEKTLKVRANHYLTPYMNLRSNCGSDRAFVWYVMTDFADEEPKSEMFAIRFANAENARVFKEAFEEAVAYVTANIMTGYPCDDAPGDDDAKEDDLKEEKEEENDAQQDRKLEATSERPTKESSDRSESEVVAGLEKLHVQGDTTGEAS